MAETRVAIGRVKRDISELVNRVAYGGERVVLTSRSAPKAVLISLEDYERLHRHEIGERQARWQAWLVENQQLTAAILDRRKGQAVDVDAIWQGARADLEARGADISCH